MKKTKNKSLAILFFLFGILLIGFVSSASFSSSQSSIPGAGSLRSLSVSGIPAFSSEACREGQDFTVQIAPFGCTPKIVRSDLLEEQNVPVFCQLAATQINPLIKVDAIDSISFKGEYPKEIAGIGFYPAQAAIKSTNTRLLNSPVLANIGYAVIVLRQQPNESAMPDSVRGNLTANIRYDIETAFGVGSATYHLPELNGQQWDEKFEQYGFWNGKGFLRAESIDAGNAQISIYLDKENRLSTFNLRKGEMSPDVHLPGLYCKAGLRVRLDGLENPDTKAKFNINEDILEAGEREKFLENKCQVRSLDKHGLTQSVDIRCLTDTGSDRVTLKISPRVNLKIGDEEPKEYVLGDELYPVSGGEKFAYLGYIGETPDKRKFIIPVLSPKRNSEDFAGTTIFKVLPNAVAAAQYDTGSGILNLGRDVLTFYSGLAAVLGSYAVTGDVPLPEIYEGSSGGIIGTVLGSKKIEFLGLTVQDASLSGNTKQSYENAMKDYQTILDQFPNEKETSLSTETFGEKALFQMIILSEKLRQMKKVKDLCSELDERYPGSTSKPDICRNSIKTSNSEISSRSITINGNVKEISFEGISEPTLEDFSAEVVVSKGAATLSTFQLRKNDVVYLDESQKDWIQLLDLETDSAKVKINAEGVVGKISAATSTESEYNFVTRSEAEVLAAVQKLDSNLADNCKPYVRPIIEASNENGIDPLLLLSLMIQESGCNSAADSGSSVGLMQVNLIHCGNYGLSDNENSCKSELISDVNMNIEVGARILKENLDFNPRQYKCSAFSGLTKTSTATNEEFQNEPAIDKTYSGWEKALRSYNGWGCASATTFADQGFVEEVIDRFTDLESSEKSLAQKAIDAIKNTLRETSERATKNAVSSISIKSDEKILKKNVADNFGSQYTFTLTRVNLKKVAKVSVAPNIRNAGTEANFSFQVGIDKRAIQLSPETIKERIDTLNQSIEKWEDTSETLGEAVKTFNAACLLTGTALTVKNFVENTDGKAIARQEVMRKPGGYRDICTEEIVKTKVSMDKCLLDYSDEIERDVNKVHQAMQSQKPITDENVAAKLEELRGSSNLDCGNKDKDVCEAFTKEGYDDRKVSLTQIKDLERYNKILEANPSEELRILAEKNRNSILTQIDKNAEGLAEFTSYSDDLEKNTNLEGVTVISGGSKDAIVGGYGGGKTTGQVGSIGPGSPVQALVFNNTEYLLKLAKTSGDNYRIVSVHNSDGGLVTSSEANAINARYGKGLVLRDGTTYNNPIKNPEVKYYETTQYKGLPAIVPFDTSNGWYAATRPIISGGGSINAVDQSGRVTSFWVCNVMENGNPDFNQGSLGTGDDECRQYNPGTGIIQGDFQDLGPSTSNKLVSDAQSAISDAQRQYKSGITGAVRILGRQIKVGGPAVEIPTTQCSDFMSPEDCNLLFNVCDPVVCPSSRCNLGGDYNVPDVVQSGIVGSIALCLPNAKENIAVPICLSGVKAGLDGYVSIQKSYRECLQENLESGRTIGLCDEIHSIYLCDFFWKQAAPISESLVPKIFDFISGRGTPRGGGEYLNLASAWKNAGDSVDYMAQYYGANRFSSFGARFTEEFGSAICKGFISGTVPSVIDSLIEPRSPVQYTAWFSESTFTTATVPATSQYKVFYHIYAGENNDQNSGAFYNVYLKSPVGTSFYQTAPTRAVASGYIKKGEFASETRDFTAPTGYKEVCVNINGQEQCGFKKVTTEFAINYLNDLAVQEQASQTDIKTERECVSGTPTLFGLINPNLQAGASDAINPELYNQGIVRICATSPPGKNTEPGRWKPVGTCDEGRGEINCYLDSQSVKNVIKSTSIEEETLKTAGSKLEEELKKTGIFTESEFDKLIKELNKLRDSEEYQKIISRITEDIIKKTFFNFQKAKLYLFRGDAHGELAGQGKIAEDVFVSGEKRGEERDVPEESGTTINRCGECGDGVFNVCDEIECSGLGDCVFIENPGFIKSVGGTEIGICEEETGISITDNVYSVTFTAPRTVILEKAASRDKEESFSNKEVVNIESGVFVSLVGSEMNNGIINIRSGVAAEYVGSEMNNGIINIFSGAGIGTLGLGMKGGTINIFSGAKIDSLVGWQMKGGRINIERGAIVQSKTINRGGDLSGIEVIDPDGLSRGWIKFFEEV